MEGPAPSISPSPNFPVNMTQINLNMLQPSMLNPFALSLLGQIPNIECNQQLIRSILSSNLNTNFFGGMPREGSLSQSVPYSSMGMMSPQMSGSMMAQMNMMRMQQQHMQLQQQQMQQQRQQQQQEPPRQQGVSLFKQHVNAQQQCEGNK